ncbi:MAG: hypothetical protein WBH31_13200, partial [Promethearchaeia archaeon]
SYINLNFTLILCRIIYKIMQELPDIPQKITDHPKLPSSFEHEILEYMLNEMIAQKKINFEFLNKFYKLSLEEFQENYEKLQVKISSDMIYYNNFRNYLEKLIKSVYKITHSIRKKSKLSKIELVIIKDLANFNFRWNPIKVENYYFYSCSKKKCNYCKQILPIEKFGKYGSERGKKGGRQSYRTICKSCRREKKSIRGLRKKLRLILELFNGKCNKCDTNLLYLPSFEFHHVNKLSKKKSWRKINYKAYNELKQWIINEKVIILCGNCHLKQQSKYFNEFKELVLKENLFNYSQDKIEGLLDNAIKNSPSCKDIREKSKIKYQIKRWIRKRYVIEQLYDAKCVACGLKANKNLPSMVFHHLDESVKDFTWFDLRDFDCVEILDLLIKEKCICMCSNCHSILHSNYPHHVKEIMKGLYTEKGIETFTLKLDTILNSINQNITGFKFNLEKVNFNSPLKYEIDQNDIWKTKTLKIFLYCKQIKQNEFRTNDIMILFNNNYHSAYEIITKLLEKGYLNKVIRDGFTQNYFAFNNKGLRKVNEFKQKFMHIMGKIHEELENLNNENLNNVSRMEHDDILNVYPETIKEIIKKKGYNEFTIKELADAIGKTSGHVSKILREKLIAYGIVKLVKSPIYTKITRSTKVYGLTAGRLDFLVN